MSFGIKLPITYDSASGFTSLESFAETIKQNFKMLLLTDPGERVMLPDYGVGVRTFLFNNFDTGAEARLKSKIMEQVNIFMPLLVINDLFVSQSDVGLNSLNVSIYYTIPDLGIQELLKFTI